MKTRELSSENVDKLKITETRAAQRKTTVPSLWSPENAESADRKTSMQTKKSSTALAI
jgi:hypothetical protein